MDNYSVTPPLLGYRRGERKRLVTWWWLALGALALSAAAYFGAAMKRVAAPADYFTATGVTRYQLRRVQTGLVHFRLDTGRFPTGQEGLAALVNRPAGLAGWKGPYLDQIQNDPWGRPYVYNATAAAHHMSFGSHVSSRGPDGVAGTADDISSEDMPFPRDDG